MDILLGWWIICMVPYPEPEGIVCLDYTPKIGDKIELPSEEKSHPVVTSADITHRHTATKPGTDEEKAALENADFSEVVEAGNNFAMRKANEVMSLPLPPTPYLMDYQGGTITVKDVVHETLGGFGSGKVKN